MTFDEVKEAVKEYGSEIGTILPGQKWVQLTGPFTADQLKVIVKEINKRGDTN